MATIEKLIVDHYRIPLPVVLSDSTHGDMHDFALVTVRIIDSDGAEGLGYGYTVGNIGGDAMRSLIDKDLRHAVVGEDASRIEQLWEKMWWYVHYVGRGGLASFAMAAIDVALWDLKAKKADEPLWRFLGGHDTRVQAYAGGIDLQFTIDALLEQADGFRADNFSAIKMKIGRKVLSEDVERVTAMRRHLGDDFPLLADANMGWSVDHAVRAARSVRDLNLVWIEEPTIPDDIEGHAVIAREGGVPIATGENFHTIYEFKNMIDRGGVSFPEPDLVTLGGITPWLKVARYAEASNLPVTSHGVHDLHVHLLAAVPNSSFLEIHGFGLNDYIEHPLTLDDQGYAHAPMRTGHGISFDFDALESLRA